MLYKDDLFSIMDIEKAEELEYFESLADFIEADDEVDFDGVYLLFRDCNKEILINLINDYFEEISDFIPDSETQFAVLLENIKRNLTGIAGEEMSEEDRAQKLATEFLKFRDWYSLNSSVACRNIDRGIEEECTIRDAIANLRGEKLGADSYETDFSTALEYDLDEYVINLKEVFLED